MSAGDAPSVGRVAGQLTVAGEAPWVRMLKGIKNPNSSLYNFLKEEKDLLRNLKALNLRLFWNFASTMGGGLYSKHGTQKIGVQGGSEYTFLNLPGGVELTADELKVATASSLQEKYQGLPESVAFNFVGFGVRNRRKMVQYLPIGQVRAFAADCGIAELEHTMVELTKQGDQILFKGKNARWEDFANLGTVAATLNVE